MLYDSGLERLSGWCWCWWRMVFETSFHIGVASSTGYSSVPRSSVIVQ